MPDYIGVPIETDPDVLAQESYDYLQSQVPGWEPAEGNLETILIDTGARRAAELRDLASRVPTSIFRQFGEIVGVLPLNGAKASVGVTVTAIDNKGYTIPAETQLGFRTSGDEMVLFEVLADIVIAPGSTTGAGTAIALDEGASSSDLGGAGQAMTLVTPLDSVVSVTMSSATSGGTDAEDDATYLNRLASKMQTLTDRPILPVDFAILARDIAGVARATALDGYTPEHNLLSLNAASIETDASGWVVNSGCTIARSVAQAADGSASLAMTSTSTSGMSVRGASSERKTVTPGETMTAIGSFRAAATARTIGVGITWRDAGGSVISEAWTQTLADTTTGWTQTTHTATAPALAATGEVLALVSSTASGETHYVDKLALRRNSGTTWYPGGTPETGNTRTVTVVPVDEDGEPLSAPVMAQIDDHLQSLREINFVVNVASPTYSNVDVTFTVVSLTGSDTTDLHDRIVAALQEYFSPANWGLPEPGVLFAQGQQEWNLKTMIRFREVDQVINNVVGVDYIVDVTIGRDGGAQVSKTDIALPGPAPLPRPGTIVGTVT